MNKLKFLIGCFVSLACVAQSQELKFVKDSLTNKPIPYVNIWVENKLIGTSSDERGVFSLPIECIGKTIFLSSVGYSTKRTIYNDNIQHIYLKAGATLLRDVVVTQKRKNQRRQLGEFKQKNIRHYFSCSGFPYIIGKFFPYSEDHANMYLDKIAVFTWSQVKQAKLNIKLYTKDEADFKSILDENLIVTTNSGSDLTWINVADKNIEMPKTGILIGVEFLIIESNKREFKYSMEGKKELLTGINYEPKVGTIPKESNENSWQFSNGKWIKSPRSASRLPEYHDKFTEPAIKISLSN